MRPDYKNWTPKGMVLGFLAGALAFLALAVIFGCTPLLAAGVLRTILTIVFILAALVFCGLTVWGFLMYRAFDYNGKRQMSRQIIEGIASYVDLPKGQKVISIMGEMGRDFDGGYEEYVLLPNEQICPVETDLPWEVLAAVPETYYTAFGSYQNLMIREGDRILVRGATSGVGIAFARLVKAAFPSICLTGSSRSADKAEALLGEGFDRAVIDKDGILQTEEQYDKALELIGPATLKNTFAHIGEGGIVCSTGQLGGVWDLDLEPIMELPANGYLTSFYSGNVSSDKLNRMLRFIEDHHVNAAPEKVFTLEQTSEAHRYLESSHSFGKTVVILN